MPGVPVIIPDMVYYEATRNFAKLGSEQIVEWARRHRGQVEIAPTTTFAEFQTLRVTNPRTQSGEGNGPRLRYSTPLWRKTPRSKRSCCSEDSDVKTRRFVRALPERVAPLSTGDFLYELEKAGRIQSSDHILDIAEANARNIEAQREPQADEQTRALLREQLTAQQPDDLSADPNAAKKTALARNRSETEQSIQQGQEPDRDRGR
jgi:hypothetical protein